MVRFSIVMLSACLMPGSDKSRDDTVELPETGYPDIDTAMIDNDPCKDVSVSVDIVDVSLAPQQLQDDIASDDGSWSGPAVWSDLQTTQVSVEVIWDTAHVVHRYQSLAGDGVPTPECLDEWATPVSLQIVSTDGRLDHTWEVEMRGRSTTFLYNVALDLGVVHADVRALLAPGDDELLFAIQWDDQSVDGGHAFSGHGGLRSHEVLSF
jgi:hypothetical protein